MGIIAGLLFVTVAAVFSTAISMLFVDVWKKRKAEKRYVRATVVDKRYSYANGDRQERPYLRITTEDGSHSGRIYGKRWYEVLQKNDTIYIELCIYVGRTGKVEMWFDIDTIHPRVDVNNP